jgi:hypothetical protein
MSSPLTLQRGCAILNLPPEILHLIFSYFEYPYDTHPQGAGWYEQMSRDELLQRGQDEEHRQQSIRNARLVCRLFNEFASPLLYVCLELGLDQRSLDFTEHLSTHPQLAKGLRHVSLCLDYWPEEFAADLEGFWQCTKVTFDRDAMQARTARH